MQDPVTVALKRRAQEAIVLFPQPASRLVRPYGQRREPRLLMPTDLRFERIGDSSR
jgi:hypothetical protein